MKLSPVESFQLVQHTLQGDCALCLKTGMSVEAWVGRIQLLLYYSVPPDEHTEVEDNQGKIWHRFRHEKWPKEAPPEVQDK